MASNETVFRMRFGKIYRLLLDKAVKKGRTEEEVHQVTAWLTGYSPEFLLQAMDTDLTYGDFFRQAPHPNPNREKIKGVVCGVRWKLWRTPSCGRCATWTNWWTSWPKARPWRPSCAERPLTSKTGPSPLLRRNWVRFFTLEARPALTISRRPSRPA